MGIWKGTTRNSSRAYFPRGDNARSFRYWVEALNLAPARVLRLSRPGLGLVAASVVFLYKLDNPMMERIQAELAERRGTEVA